MDSRLWSTAFIPPYTWRDDLKLGDLTRDELPALTEAQAREFIERATAILAAQPDWGTAKKPGNGAAEPSAGQGSDYHDLYSERTTAADRNYAKSALEDECQQLRMMPRDSGRNNELNNAGCKLGGFIPKYLSRATVEQELYQASVSNLLVHDTSPRQVRATIQSGLTKGLQTPRVIPERNFASEAPDDLAVPDTPLNEWDA